MIWSRLHIGNVYFSICWGQIRKLNVSRQVVVSREVSKSENELKPNTTFVLGRICWGVCCPVPPHPAHAQASGVYPAWPAPYVHSWAVGEGYPRAAAIPLTSGQSPSEGPPAGLPRPCPACPLPGGRFFFKDFSHASRTQSETQRHTPRPLTAFVPSAG